MPLNQAVRSWIKRAMEECPEDFINQVLCEQRNNDPYLTEVIICAFSRIAELEKSLEQFRSDAYRDFEYHNER